MACAVHQERVPPQGFAHGAIVQLTVPDAPDAHAFQWPAHRGRLVSHAVLARDDVLRIFEVRERGASTELVQVRMHRLFGEVTGVLRVRTLASQYDGRDRVLLAFADAKLAEYQSGARPPSGGLSPAGSSPNSAALHAQETTIAEALALYVRALGFLQRGLTAINAYAETLRDAEPSDEMRDYAHWFRTHFQRCYERSMYARGLCSPSTLPDNVQQADRQIFDKALELARAAALDELEGNRDGLSWDPTSCVLAYETAASLLQGLLDPGEEHMGLSMNSVLLVEKFLKSIHKRLGALQTSTQLAPAPA